MNNNAIFVMDLPRSSRARANTNNEFRPPLSPISNKNQRGRSSGFSEENLNLRFNNDAAGVASAASAIKKETVLANFWRIVNLVFQDPRVRRNIVKNFNTVVIKIPGKSNNIVVSSLANSLKDNAKPSQGVFRYSLTKNYLNKLLSEAIDVKGINFSITPLSELSETLFGLEIDDLGALLKVLHPDPAVLLENGVYSESYVQNPGRFLSYIKNYALYKDEFLEWVATTDHLSTYHEEYIAIGKPLLGVFGLVNILELGGMIPDNSRLEDEYSLQDFILIKNDKIPPFIQKTTTFPIYDLGHIVDSLMKTEALQKLFRKQKIAKISPRIRAILEANPSYRALLVQAFPPTQASPPTLVTNYHRRRMGAKGVVAPMARTIRTSGGTRRRSSRKTQRRKNIAN